MNIIIARIHTGVDFCAACDKDDEGELPVGWVSVSGMVAELVIRHCRENMSGAERNHL
jgi:hypothetical protein